MMKQKFNINLSALKKVMFTSRYSTTFKIWQITICVLYTLLISVFLNFVDFCEALGNITKFEIKKFRSNIGKF